MSISSFPQYFPLNSKLTCAISCIYSLPYFAVNGSSIPSLAEAKSKG